MKKLLILFLLFAIGGFSLNQEYAPCETPRTYKIGSIDERFNISNNELLTTAKKASDVWAYNSKQLFSYDPKGGITVNLVYDQRQSLTSDINSLEGELEKEQSGLKPQIAEYQRLSAEFKKRVDDLNARIESWNNQGGAPPDEYEKLKNEQQELKQQADSLNDMARKLNQSTDSYNSQVGSLNTTINTFNQAITARPEQGLYNSADNSIDIYFLANRDELSHTLSHEFGHARGLGHIEDPQSLMFAKTSQITQPSVQDLQAVDRVCAKKSYFEIIKKQFPS